MKNVVILLLFNDNLKARGRVPEKKKEQKNPDYLLISNFNNKLRLNQFLGTKITETISL